MSINIGFGNAYLFYGAHRAGNPAEVYHQAANHLKNQFRSAGIAARTYEFSHPHDTSTFAVVTGQELARSGEVKALRESTPQRKSGTGPIAPDEFRNAEDAFRDTVENNHIRVRVNGQGELLGFQMGRPFQDHSQIGKVLSSLA